MKSDGTEVCKLCDKAIVGEFVSIAIHGKYHDVCDMCDKQLYYHYAKIITNKIKNR